MAVTYYFIRTGGEVDMSIKTILEKNPTIWLLSSLATGFGAGIAGYDKIIDISGQELISISEKKILEEKIQKLETLEDDVKRYRAREGKQPDSHRLVLTSALNENDVPIDSINVIRLDEKFYIYSRWFGVSEVGFYEKHLKLAYEGKVVWEDKYQFLAGESGEWNSWRSLTLRSAELPPGVYRLTVLLNGIRFEDREMHVEAAH